MRVTVRRHDPENVKGFVGYVQLAVSTDEPPERQLWEIGQAIVQAIKTPHGKWDVRIAPPRLPISKPVLCEAYAEFITETIRVARELDKELNQ